MRLPFPEDEINCPAAPDVRTVAAAMLDQLLIVVPGIKQSVGEDGKAGVVQRPLRHPALLVDPFGEAAYCAIAPGEDCGRQRMRRAKGVAENTPQQSAKDGIPLLLPDTVAARERNGVGSHVKRGRE